MRCTTIALVSCLTVVRSAPLAAQVPATPADSVTALYRSAEYQAERRRMEPLGGSVVRDGGSLVLHLRSGRLVTFADTLAEGESYHRYVYAGHWPEEGVHVVQLVLYEGDRYVVVHDRTGEVELIPGEPLRAPQGGRLASASVDLDAMESPNRLQIWRVDSTGFHLEFNIDGGDRWGPDSVRWIGPARLAYMRLAAKDGGPAGRTYSWLPRYVERRAGRWRVVPARHCRLAERCTTFTR